MSLRILVETDTPEETAAVVAALRRLQISATVTTDPDADRPTDHRHLRAVAVGDH